MVYQRKGISIKVTSSVDRGAGYCVTSFDWHIKDQFNFKGRHAKKFFEEENYSDVRAIDKEKKYFYFNQKEYLNMCSFSIDIKKDLIKSPVNIQDLIRDAESKPAESLYSKEFYNELEGPIVRIGTPTLNIAPGCYGHYDYGRGVFLYKTNWFWTWGQGTATRINKDHEEESIKIAVNFGGAIAHPDHMKSNEDYFKINSKLIRLHPVKMIYDDLNHMNGFVFRTAEEFRSRETQTVNLVFTSNKELFLSNNFLILKVNDSEIN
jgi:hypothetical protein